MQMVDLYIMCVLVLKSMVPTYRLLHTAKKTQLGEI